jgi:hypothetical protein
VISRDLSSLEHWRGKKPERQSTASPNVFQSYHTPQETRSSRVTLCNGYSDSLGEDFAAKVALEGKRTGGFDLTTDVLPPQASRSLKSGLHL